MRLSGGIVMSKKKQKTYNHYVPQFYLKNFSGNDSIGSVYDIVKLPMFKINSFFKTVPFPCTDEIGPLRKAVYEKMFEGAFHSL